MRHFCDFCSSSSDDGVTVLKMTKSMLESLGRPNSDLYICSSHFPSPPPIRQGVGLHGRTRFLHGAQLPVEILNRARQEESDTESEDESDAGYQEDMEEDEDDEVVYQASQNSQVSVEDSRNETPKEESQEYEEGASGTEDDEEWEEEYYSQESEPKSSQGSHQKAPSYLITSWTSILVALSVCLEPGCGDIVTSDNIQWSKQGAAVSFTMTCNSNHVKTWESSSFFRRQGPGRPKSVLNMALSAWLLMCGSHYDNIKGFFLHLGCGFLGKTTYYTNLKIIYPNIWKHYLKNQRECLDKVKELSEVILCGDGRFDSPGFTARYCTYFIQCTTTKKIIAMYVCCKDQVGGISTRMEPASCKSLLNFLQRVGVTINFFATDRSSSIRKMMARDFANICHEFDIWHFIKNISKTIFKKSRKASGRRLELWLKSIRNVLWAALESTRGNIQKCKEMIFSILGHVTNVHNFPDNVDFKQCAHGDLSQQADRQPWITEDSAAYRDLKESLTGYNNVNIKDLSHMTKFIHTSDLESVNSMGTKKYMSKAYFYSHEGMKVRAALTVQDFNHSTDRPQAETKSGKLQFKKKVNRARTSQSLAPLMVTKDYTWKHDIFQDILTSCETGLIPDLTIHKSVAPVNLPMTTEELLLKHRSRMGRKLGNK